MEKDRRQMAGKKHKPVLWDLPIRQRQFPDVDITFTDDAEREKKRERCAGRVPSDGVRHEADGGQEAGNQSGWSHGLYKEKCCRNESR